MMNDSDFDKFIDLHAKSTSENANNSTIFRDNLLKDVEDMKPQSNIALLDMILFTTKMFKKLACQEAGTKGVRKGSRIL